MSTEVLGDLRARDAVRREQPVEVPAHGRRQLFSGTKRTVIDGPFAEAKELIAGFWIWEVKSLEEAVEWVKRCPNPLEGESEIEIRPVYEAEDFGEAMTPELREKEERLRAQTAQLAAALEK
jgi:hypothetical protein